MSDSFILELILSTTIQDKKVLDICLEMARHLYNAVLSEAPLGLYHIMRLHRHRH